MKFLVLVLSLLSVSCTELAYKDDIGFLSSAQANSMEFLATVNGKTCKDMDNFVGACAKRVSTSEDLLFSFDARPYSYRLNVECTKALEFNLSVDVLKNKSYSFKIPREKYVGLASFTCIGEVFPDDREDEVSASFSVRVIIFDSNYRKREEINLQGSNLVLGEHSLYATVDGKSYEKKTYLKVKKGAQKAMSESYMMRFNYYGY